jgi:hypothetical protein
MDLMQSEVAQYKLDGLLLLIAGVGRNRSDGKSVLQAFATISNDDEDGTYRLRAFNDGHYLETEVKLAEDGRGLTWGFVFGELESRCYALRTTAHGQKLARLRLARNHDERFWNLRFDERSKASICTPG